MFFSVGIVVYFHKSGERFVSFKRKFIPCFEDAILAEQPRVFGRESYFFPDALITCKHTWLGEEELLVCSFVCNVEPGSELCSRCWCGVDGLECLSGKHAEIYSATYIWTVSWCAALIEVSFECSYDDSDCLCLSERIIWHKFPIASFHESKCACFENIRHERAIVCGYITKRACFGCFFVHAWEICYLCICCKKF